MKKTLIGLLAVALSLTAFSCDSPFASVKEGTVVNNSTERANEACSKGGEHEWNWGPWGNGVCQKCGKLI